MMALEVGAAYVTLMPSALGFSAAVKKQIKPGMETSGKEVGADFGKQITASTVRGTQGMGQKITQSAQLDKAGKAGGQKFDQGFTTHVKGMGGKLRGIMGPMIAGAVGGAVMTGVVGVFQGAVQAAGDYNDAVGTTEVVWKKNKQVVLDWAKTADKAMGLSQQQALDTGNRFGNMFQQMGIDSKTSQKMMEKSMQRSADVGAMYGAKTEDVAAAMQSAYRGEYESLQRYIPMANGANITKEALRMTGKKNVKQLTDEEKAMAVYSFVMGKTANAQGRFRAEAESLTGAQKIQAAATENLKKKFGEVFLPVMTDVTNFMADTAIPAMEDLIQSWKDGTGPLGALKGALEKTGTALKDTFKFFQDNSTEAQILGGLLITGVGLWAGYRTALILTQTQIKLTAAAQLLLNGALLANPLGLVAGLLFGLGAAYMYAYHKNDEFRRMVDTSLASIKIAISIAVYEIKKFLLRLAVLFTQAKIKAQEMGAGISGAFNSVKTSVVLLWAEIGTKLSSIGQSFINMKTVILGALKPLIDGFNTFKDAVTSFSMPSFSMPSFDFPSLYKAKGGILPGYTPGRDVHMFTSPTAGTIGLSGGEAIMRPEWTRAVGPKAIDKMNRMAATGGVGGVRNMLGFANGGIVNFASGGVYQGMAAWLKKALPGIAITSSYRPGARTVSGNLSNHALGRALDLSPSMAAFNTIRSAFGPHIAELIFTPAGGRQIKNGKPTTYGPAVAAGHRNHIHWAMNKWPPPGYALNKTGQVVFGGLPAGTTSKAVSKTAGPVSAPYQWQKTMADITQSINQAGAKAVNPDSTFANLIQAGLERELGVGKAANPKALSTGATSAIPAVAKAVGGGIKGLVQQLASARGWGSGGQWAALDWIIQRESGWKPSAKNPRSTAYGLFQFLDSTWKTVGAKKTSDPRGQALAGLAYIAQRYKNPLNAQAFWKKNGWYSSGGIVPTLYDTGGVLPPGTHFVSNQTGKNETIRTHEQENSLQAALAQGGGDVINISGVKYDSVEDVMSALNFARARKSNRGRYRSLV